MMPIETDEDRATFLNTDDFGVEAIWTSMSGSSVPLPCIFDDTFLAVAAGDIDFSADGATISILLRTLDVPNDARQGDLIACGDEAYKVVSFRPDGTGMTLVRLMEA